jgi:hypothetical protein
MVGFILVTAIADLSERDCSRERGNFASKIGPTGEVAGAEYRVEAFPGQFQQGRVADFQLHVHLGHAGFQVVELDTGDVGDVFFAQEKINSLGFDTSGLMNALSL